MTRRPDHGATECAIASSQVIALSFYGELTAPERAAFESHVAACGECRRALEELVLIRATLAARPAVAAPKGGEWDSFMSRLERAVAGDGVAAARPLAPLASRRPSYAGDIAMAALLALVTLNVVFVARSRSAAMVTSTAAAQPRAAVAGEDVVAFEALSEEHFERSKLVVLGLATKDAGHSKAGDWTYERQLAAALLSDTRMYRLAAEDRGLRSLAGVMRDLELVLLQTALTDETDPSSLAQIQRLIGKRDLLQKMDAVATAGL